MFNGGVSEYHNVDSYFEEDSRSGNSLNTDASNLRDVVKKDVHLLSVGVTKILRIF